MSPTFVCIALAASIPVAAGTAVLARATGRRDTDPTTRHLIWSLSFWITALAPAAIMAGLLRPFAPSLRVELAPAHVAQAPVMRHGSSLLAHSPQWAAVAILLLLGASAFVALARLTRTSLKLQAVRRRAQTPDQGVQTRIRAGSALPASALILSSDEIGSAFVVGLRHPALLLPHRLLDEPEAASMVCRHEAAHLRRFDHWRALAEALAIAILSYNPLLRLIHRQLSAAREEICDAWAVRGADATLRRVYAATLINALAEPAVISPAIALTGDARHAAPRLAAILNPAPRPRRRLLMVGVGATLLAWGGGAIAAAQTAAPPAAPAAPAAESVVDGAIDIEADSLTVSRDKHTSFWSGNVQIRGHVDGAKHDVVLDGRPLAEHDIDLAVVSSGGLASATMTAGPDNSLQRLELSSRR